ncbi:hypothetical protein BV898_08350 [Hypsibius exemplaris]|uniref:G-protein coupled receptors family 1 profile domain-containing protein n=1 Tax=Hypsibius exemplaris TaxID=2072580 RepID=A0A1W0WQW5_HYPEX|nr:hypothetical protein BV898_08350 [Hypsibius exemplaris]
MNFSSSLGNLVAFTATANLSGLSNATSNVTLRCGWPKEDRRSEVPHIEYVDMVTYPILLALSTIGNALNVFVLRRERPQSSKNVYLITMACSDICYMWAQFCPYTKDRIPDPSDWIVDSLSAANGVILFLQETAAFVSDWTIVAFSIDRLLAICSPLHHKMICSISRSTTIAMGIITVAVLLASCRLVDYYWWYANDPGFGPVPVRPIELKHLRTMYNGSLFVLPALTFLAILTINSVLMHIINRKRKSRLLKLRITLSSTPDARGALTTSNTTRKVAAAASEHNASIMLATCVLLYLITQTPSAVFMVLQTLDSTCIRRHSRHEESVTEPIKLFCLNLNFSLNFVLYCAVNPAFRTALRKHLRRACGGQRSRITASIRTLRTSLRSKTSVRSASPNRVSLLVGHDPNVIAVCPRAVSESMM